MLSQEEISTLKFFIRNNLNLVFKGKSEKIFEKRLAKNVLYKNFFNKNTITFDNNQRCYIELNGSIKEEVDEGWMLFKQFFCDFCIKVNITYENFNENKINIKGQSFKLFKAVENFYRNRGIPAESIKREIEQVGTKKISNKKLYFVISFNLLDWFFVSTCEKWTSCYNAFDGCRRKGLPQLLMDNNRFLIYITTKDKKTINIDEADKSIKPIVLDKIIARSWVLKLKSKKGTFFNVVKEYPIQIGLDKILHCVLKDEEIELYYTSFNHEVSSKKFPILKYRYDDNKFYEPYMDTYSMFLYSTKKFTYGCKESIFFKIGKFLHIVKEVYR